VDVEQFEKVYQKIKNSEELIKLGKDDRDRDRYTTKEMLDIEYRMVRQSQSLSDTANHQIDLEYRERVIKDKGLSESQGEAFRHITGDRDMACVVGYAGSGKSYMLGAARKVWEKEGYNVVGMTLSGIAAENLEGDSGIKSYTVANRMVNWNNERERLQKNDIVVVDEAGMLGSRDLSKIIDEKSKTKTKTNINIKYNNRDGYYLELTNLKANILKENLLAKEEITIGNIKLLTKDITPQLIIKLIKNMK
jgi:ATP-dependent exoDNAse (exonuclease V) alpha subunit